MGKVLSPWTAIKVQETENEFIVYVTDREYTFEKNKLFISSITSLGQELLNGGLLLKGVDTDEPIKLTDAQTFLFEKADDKVTFIASAQSTSFIFNVSTTIEYDGCTFFELTVVPRSLTVRQAFGFDKFVLPKYELSSLSVEIPLSEKVSKYFHYFPRDNAKNEDGSVRDSVFNSGELKQTVHLPFASVLWFGNENVGLNWFAESDEHWKYEENDALTIVKGEQCKLCVNLLNDAPDIWDKTLKPDMRLEVYRPVTFAFGLQATPVKPYPKKPYSKKILHIDCFKKVVGDYLPFLSSPVVDGDTEIGFDRIKRLGVDTLILHEKWNRVQNSWIIDEQTKKDTKIIIDECHKRGIGVIPYFGYEFSTLNPLIGKYFEKVRVSWANGFMRGGWYRSPWQRDYVVCYNGEWGDKFAQGVCQVVEEMGFDGLYFDGTLTPYECANEKHGCGYRTKDGKLKETFNIVSRRETMKKIYEYMDERGKLVNIHISSCMNNMGAGFTHLILNGEDIQRTIQKKGLENVPEDYIRSEYLGRNTGIPNELLVYEFEGIWSFNDSLSFALPNGLMPRAVDIGKPLEILSRLWEIFDKYPTENCVFKPYWEGTGGKCTNEKIKISRHEGDEYSLCIIANPQQESVEEEVGFDYEYTSYEHLYGGEKLQQKGKKFIAKLGRYDCIIVALKK